MRLLDEAREVGHRQRPGPENQDSQRLLDQPRGSFLEGRATTRLLRRVLRRVLKTTLTLQSLFFFFAAKSEDHRRKRGFSSLQNP